MSVPVAMGLALATGFVTASVQPPLTSIVQMIVPVERLTQGIVLRTMGQNLAQFFGTAVGGLAIASLDYGGAFAVLAVGYLVGGAAMLGVHLPAAAPSTTVRPRMADAAREGMRFVFSDRALRSLVIFSVISGLFMLGPTFVLIPEIGREKLHVGPGPNSLLLALLGVGMFVMSLFLLTRREVHRKGNWFVVNLLFAGPLMVLTGWSTSYWFTAVVMALWGLGGGVYVNLNQTLIQTNTPNAMMGRVMSIYSLSIAGIIPLGSLLAGGGAAVIGADRYQMLSGVILGLAAVWGFFTQRELRALD
ncbi:MAG: MFS transporter [Dehalococcoidia bacterium]|nr:MAG: MFS transporter [Dehalococcoidia bacterium]